VASTAALLDWPMQHIKFL